MPVSNPRMMFMGLSQLHRGMTPVRFVRSAPSPIELAQPVLGGAGRWPRSQWARALVAVACLTCGCVPSQKCNYQKMTAGERLVTLLDHLRRNENSPWATKYPEVLRGEYTIEANAIEFAQGGVVYGRKDLLHSSPAGIEGGDIVLVASPEYIGCGDEYVVVYWNGRYSLAKPDTAEFNQARRLLHEWSGGVAK